MNKVKAYLYLSIMAILSIMLMITSTVGSATVSAATSGSGETGSSDTARKKEVWSIFSDCISDPTAWNTTQSFPGFAWEYVTSQKETLLDISAEKLQNGEWFSGHIVGVQSPYTEYLVAGKYSDGKLKCNESGDTSLLNAAINTFSINQKDIICNPADEYQDNGIISRANTDSSCGNVYDKGGSGKENAFRAIINKPYLNNIIDEIFNGEVPAGSVKELTSVEHYFVLYDSFMAVCANGEGSKYTIKEVSGGKLVDKSYDGQYKRNGEYKYFYDKTASCQEMAEGLKEGSEYVTAVQDYLNNGGAESEKKTEEEQSSSEKAEDNCQNSGGASSLGWIVCSILDWMSEATNNLYKDVVKPALQVEADFFEDSNTSNAWSQFQNIANTIFIILVLIVIFSQLTGVGIDNYGIKKILPKLIVAAILINLSYVICVLCVDLSNILGSGFQNFFEELSSKVAPASRISVGGGTVNINVGADVGIFAVGLVSIGVGAVAIYSNPALLLTLFVTVLGVLIAVLFLFVLLAGRKALIVLLTVVSPVAFVLYMLPNTKKIFDKWLKLWEAMLILYPVCGLLIGGGNFASRLILSIASNADSGVGMFFIAMVVGIIPIFLIPTLVKGAFSALGSFGGTIAGFGGRMRGGFEKGARNTNAYKVAQKRGQARRDRFNQLAEERHTRRRAGLKADGTERNGIRARLSKTKFGEAMGITRNMSDARAQYAKDQASRDAEAKFMNEGYMQNLAAAREEKARDESVDQQLAFIRRNGVKSGEDGKSSTAFNTTSAGNRIEQLASNAKKNGSLTGQEQLELAALARGLANEKGGGGTLANAIRGANKGGINKNFMSAMGEVYARDSAVKGKLNEKDAAASAFAEQFLPNSATSFEDGASFGSFRAENQGKIGERIKTYSQGLNQSGTAMREYVDTLGSSDIQSIMDDKSMWSGLEAEAREAVKARAQSLNMPSASSKPQAPSQGASPQDYADYFEKLKKS